MTCIACGPASRLFLARCPAVRCPRRAPEIPRGDDLLGDSHGVYRAPKTRAARDLRVSFDSKGTSKGFKRHGPLWGLCKRQDVAARRQPERPAVCRGFSEARPDIDAGHFRHVLARARGSIRSQRGLGLVSSNVQSQTGTVTDLSPFGVRSNGSGAA